jgi:TatD DNase family protein
MIIDTHCHYDMFDDPAKIIKESERQKVITIGMTNLPSHFEMGFPHIKGFKYVRLAVGLHPLLVKNHNTELSGFKRAIDKTSYVGEVGLDFSKEGISTKNIQIESFKFVLDTIKNKKKIVSLHSRKAEKQVLELLLKYKIENAIFHWYSGSITVLRQILDNGYYFSINPSMISSISGQKIISEIPLDRILTETDSPYTSIRNRKTKPADVRFVINYLSESYKYSVDDIEKKIYSNFMNLIGKIK